MGNEDKLRGLHATKALNDTWTVIGIAADGAKLVGHTNDERLARTRAAEMKSEGYPRVRLGYNPGSGPFEHEFYSDAPTLRDVFTMAMHEQAPHLTIPNIADALGVDIAQIHSRVKRLIDAGVVDCTDFGTSSETWHCNQRMPKLEDVVEILGRPHLDFDIDSVLPVRTRR